MVKKKRHKAFWSNIKFKYKLTIINENTLEEVVGIRVSKLNGRRHHYFYSFAQLPAGVYEQ